MANGSSGRWEIAVDEQTSGADRWFLQIEGPPVYFYFEIPSLEVIPKMIRFLAPATGSVDRNGLLPLSKDKRSEVTIVRDDEYHDRFFLVVGPMTNPIVRFVIAGSDVTNIALALRQVNDDIDDAKSS